MVTFVSVILVGGVLLLIAATVMFLLTSRSARAHRAVAGAAPEPLGSGRRGLVAVQAVTDYGPSGPQVGPVSGENCVWWRVSVVRSPSRRSDGERTGEDHLGYFRSPGGAALSDGSGSLAVHPRMLDAVADSSRPAGTERSGTFTGITVPDYVPRGMVGRMRSYEDLHLVELRLPQGREIFTTGVVRGGALTPVRGASVVFTTDSRDTVLAGLARDGSAARTMMRAFGAVGLLATLVSAGLLWLH